MFEVNSSKKIFHANTLENIYNEQISNSLPYVVRTTKNNGIVGYINENQIYANEANTLSFAQDTFTVFYQKQKYFTGNKVKVLKSKFDLKNSNVMHFLVACFQKVLANLSWGDGSTVTSIQQIKIQLPINRDGDIDFEFMESFVAELEAERVAELEAYLAAASLKDYELTAAELSALSKFENYNWGEFRIGDLFEIENTFSFNKEKLTDGNEYDYVTRTSNNQGILQSTGFVNARNLNEAGIWSLGLLQMDFFYRQRQWYAGQFVRKIIPKIKLTQNSILFFTTLLNSQKNILLSVLVRDVDKTFKNLKIKLPVTANDEIDFEFMNNFIKAIEKLVIKDVVLYADNKIKATKSIVSSNQ